VSDVIAISVNAIPVMLEIGRETVARSASEEALKAVSAEIIETAMGRADSQSSG